MHAMQTLNLSGMKCPLPIVALAKFVRGLRTGESFCVFADDPAFCLDVQAWCRRSGNECVSCESQGGITTAVICRPLR